MNVSTTEGAAREKAGLAQWMTLSLLAAIYAISLIDRHVLNLLVDPLKADLGISDAQVGLLQGLAFLLVYSILGIPLGWLGDRVNRPRLIAIAIVIWSLLTAGCGLVNSFLALFLCRMGVGVAEAALTPSAVSLIAQTFPPKRMGFALSLYGVGGAAGGGLALLVGGALFSWLAAKGGLNVPLFGHLEPWQGTFVLIALPGALLPLLALRMREPRAGGGHPSGASPGASVGEVVEFYRSNWRVLLGLKLAASLIVMALLAFTSWGPAVFIRSHGWTIGQTGLVVGLAILASAVMGLPAGGASSDAMSRRGPSGRIAPALVATPLAVAAAAVFGLSSNPWIAVGALLVGLLFAKFASAAALAAVQSITPSNLRSTVTAILVTSTGLLSITAPPLVGALNDSVFEGGRDIAKALVVVVVPALLLACFCFVDAFRACRSLGPAVTDGARSDSVSTAPQAAPVRRA